MDSSPGRLVLCVLGVALLAAPVFAGKKDMKIDIENADGENISIVVSSNLIDGIIEGLSESDLSCDGDELEPDTRAMLEHLDRRGEGSRYVYTNDEGEKIEARRRNGQWEMRIENEGENDTIVSLPWAMAECMLGREVPAYSGKDKLEFKVEKDGGVRIRIE